MKSARGRPRWRGPTPCAARCPPAARRPRGRRLGGGGGNEAGGVATDGFVQFSVALRGRPGGWAKCCLVHAPDRMHRSDRSADRWIQRWIYPPGIEDFVFVTGAGPVLACLGPALAGVGSVTLEIGSKAPRKLKYKIWEWGARASRLSSDALRRGAMRASR